MHDTFRQQNYGCMFPGSPCCTWTVTDGKAPHSLIKFIFQYVPATRSHWLTYIQDETIQHDGIQYDNNNNDSNV